MENLNQIDPRLASAVRQKQSEFWDRCIVAIEKSFDALLHGEWNLEPEVSVDEIGADLAYGRD